LFVVIDLFGEFPLVEVSLANILVNEILLLDIRFVFLASLDSSRRLPGLLLFRFCFGSGVDMVLLSAIGRSLVHVGDLRDTAFGEVEVMVDRDACSGQLIGF
jgi:hypothetical protein